MSKTRPNKTAIENRFNRTASLELSYARKPSGAPELPTS
jgi:hypothetical protein